MIVVNEQPILVGSGMLFEKTGKAVWLDQILPFLLLVGSTFRWLVLKGWWGRLSTKRRRRADLQFKVPHCLCARNDIVL